MSRRRRKELPPKKLRGKVLEADLARRAEVIAGVDLHHRSSELAALADPVAEGTVTRVRPQERRDWVPPAPRVKELVETKKTTSVLSDQENAEVARLLKVLEPKLAPIIKESTKSRELEAKRQAKLKVEKEAKRQAMLQVLAKMTSTKGGRHGKANKKAA